MKRMRTYLVGILCLVAVAFSLSACGAKESQLPAADTVFRPALDTETECEIRAVANYNNFEALEAEFDRFNEYYPNVSLNYTVLDNYNDTIVAALSTEDAPDIFCAFPWMLYQEQHAPLFAAAEDLSDPSLNIDIGCIRSGLIYRDAQGRVPMLPVFSSSYGMLVNEDIFEREGLAIPTTYSSLLDACEKLKAAGYAGPVITYNDSFLMCLPMVLPYFYATIQDNAEAVRALNAMEPSAGEYLRPTLELAEDFMSHGYIDMDECNALENNYQALILRFFEGDVPMIFVNGDTVSGTAKRESLSQAFTEKPFSYSFHPIPVTENGCYFLNIVSMEFAVNKNSEQLDMANEFMRFLISTGELNELARVKRLLTTSTDFSHDGMYASFIEVDADHTIYEQDIGLQDPPIIQLRQAVWQVESGNMSIEEAIKAFGTLE